MAMVQVTAKYQENIGKKPRVYFTCHPEDLDRYFNRVCEDLWRTHDCAVYYTPDMAEAFAEEDLETDLGRNNLFAVPVTTNLLTRPNRAMDKDIPYAIENHIPVLPIMTEPGLDAIYSRPDKFGELQYLSPNGVDDTQIPYEDKLKKYLEAVLISDEMVKRIREAFDCYIFLSYRKKDRRYANELMRLIHTNPECRDIAIWFDEFLTPGESFKESIDRILHDSRLFALLVTPNLLEMPDGKPNFVMGQEYPAAKQAGLKILPAEMVSTDQLLLNQQFQGLPDCVDPHDTVFQERLLEAVKKLAIPTNNTPEHIFLIGMAYLDGIDVEVNREYALELITAAAKGGWVEAINQLYQMYSCGIVVALDYAKAAFWGEQLADAYIERFGVTHSSTITVMADLGVTYLDLGEYNTALTIFEKAYELSCDLFGDDHRRTLAVLNNLSLSFDGLGDFEKALELSVMVYESLARTMGEEDSSTINALNNLAMAYGKVGDFSKAKELIEKAYTVSSKALGKRHLLTITTLVNLAGIYGEIGDCDKELEWSQKAYDRCSQELGELHPQTLVALSNVGACYYICEDYPKAASIGEQVYILRCKVLGEYHPKSQDALKNLINVYSKTEQMGEVIKLNEQLLTSQRSFYGEDCPEQLQTLDALACAFDTIEDYEKVLELRTELYKCACKIRGKEHPDTLLDLLFLAALQNFLEDSVPALENGKKAYEAMCRVFGEDDPDTLRALKLLALCNKNVGNYALALEQYEKLYCLEAAKLEPSEEEAQELLEAMAEVKEKIKT